MNNITKKIVSSIVACFSVFSLAACNNQQGNNGNDSNYYSNDYNDSLISADLGLSLSVTKIETSGTYTYVYCKITNQSHLFGNATMYRYIKVKAIFYDKSGYAVDTDWTYAIDSTWLEVGETKTFYYMVRDTSIRSASLSIIE